MLKSLFLCICTYCKSQIVKSIQTWLFIKMKVSFFLFLDALCKMHQETLKFRGFLCFPPQFLFFFYSCLFLSSLFPQPLIIFVGYYRGVMGLMVDEIVELFKGSSERILKNLCKLARIDKFSYRIKSTSELELNFKISLVILLSHNSMHH